MSVDPILDTSDLFEAFLSGCISAILFSETDHKGNPLDKNFTGCDFSDDAMTEIRTDCQNFLNREDVGKIAQSWGYQDYQKAGTDFHFTRNGHGAGFWDGDWKKCEGEVLTAASKTAGEIHPYVGDDNLIYV